MPIRTTARNIAIALAAILLAIPPAWAKKPKPGGFNFFSREQDIQIGKEGMQEIAKKMRLCKVKAINDYVNRIGQRLIATPEARGYPYSFQVVWDKAINAFALPGGPVYINSGLILAADNEAELAGVMAHEISHIVLRHGTRQASKANLIQLGAMIGGSLLGGGGSITGQLAQLGIGFGANSVLLKYSRSAERDADLLGAYIMNDAGYNPIEMARFFEKLEAQSGNRGAIAQFFSDHPNPGNRIKRIEEEIPKMPRRTYRKGNQKELERIKALIRKDQPVETAKTGEPGAPESGSTNPQPATGGAPNAAKPGPPEPASPNSREYRGGELTLDYPDNWQVYSGQNDSSVTIAPPDGLVRMQDGSTAVARGMIVGFSPVQPGQAVDLQSATRRLIEQFRQANPSMRTAGESPRSMSVDGYPALLSTLTSQSPFPGEGEVDMLLTVARRNRLDFIIFIAPRKEYNTYQPVFERILKTLRFTYR